MICPNCGRTVQDGMKFCTTCGNRIEAPVYDATPRFAVREEAMKILGGPIFIVACICTLISFLCTVFSWFTPDYTTAILYQLGLPVNGYLNSASILMVVVKIIFSLPLLLEVIGIAILLGKVRSPHKNGGFVLIKIGLIMQLVAIAIAATVAAIAMIVALFAVGATESSEAFGMALVAVMVVIGAFVFVFAYMIGLISTVGIAKDAISDNKCVKKPSMFVAVINFMSVAGNLCFMIFLLTLAFGILGSNVAGFVFATFLPQLLNVIALLMFSILIIKGRRLVEIARKSSGYGTSYKKVSAVDMTGTTPIIEAKRCPYCGRLLRDGELCGCRTKAEAFAKYSFCTECGRPLASDEVCNCHSAAVSRRFCTNCGKVLYGNQICDCLKCNTNVL